jgi:hypothetical protein
MSKTDLTFKFLAAQYILGECRTINIEGPEEKAKCILEVLRSSRQLYLALEDSKPDLKKILELASKKNRDAQNYKNITGKNWYF